MTPTSNPRRPRLADLAAAPWRGTPLADCLAQGAGELCACADEVADLAARLGVPELSDADRQLLPGQGYDLQALLGQANAEALGGRRDVQEATGVTPEALDQARLMQAEMLRAQAAAAQLRADAEDGVRFLQAAQAHGCKQVLAWVRRELEGATGEEQARLHGMAAPLLGLWERLAAQEAQRAAREERHLRPLRAQRDEAVADARTLETLGAIARGEVVPAEEITFAAARLDRDAGDETPPDPRRRRR